MKNPVLLVSLAFLSCPFQAHGVQAAGPETRNSKGVQSAKKEKPFTILHIVRYDGSESVEVVRISEGMWRVQQLMSDSAVWKEADRLARVKWNEWLRGAENIERSARRWVLPNPARPWFEPIGQYEDEFDTEDKVKELQVQIQRRLGMRRATGDRMFLDNWHENQRFLKAMLPKARQVCIRKDELQAKRFSVVKKKAIWELVHLAEVEARKRAAEKNLMGGAPDILEIYNIQQELLKPIYAQYDIDEGQWFVIWTEGDHNKWPIPKFPSAKDKGSAANADLEAEQAARLERAVNEAEADKAARFAKASEASRAAGAEQAKKVAALSAKNETKKESEKLTPKQAEALVPDE